MRLKLRGLLGLYTVLLIAGPGGLFERDAKVDGRAIAVYPPTQILGPQYH